jgi:hypothetical protein
VHSGGRRTGRAEMVSDTSASPAARRAPRWCQTPLRSAGPVLGWASARLGQWLGWAGNAESRQRLRRGSSLERW